MSEDVNDKGLVRDLVEKVRDGEIEPDEAKERIVERGLKYVEYKSRFHFLFPILSLGGIFLCFLPLTAELTGLNSISFLPNFP